jgi:Tfp pilus assembly protein PilE
MVTPAAPPLPVPRTSGMAIAGFVLSFFCGLLGLIFSVIGRRECKNSNGLVKGEGLAIAGMAISIATLALSVLGLLAAIAIPSFMAYTQKSKRTEADLMLTRMAKSAKTAYIVNGAFPDSRAQLTPASSCCEGRDHKCELNPADWETPAWQAIDFTTYQSTRFQYRYTSTATTFEAEAVGDLDCDGHSVSYRLIVEVVDGNPSSRIIAPTTQD